MGLKRCCGSLEPVAAILNEFQQKYAFGGNSRNPNIGVFQQNRPFADLRVCAPCCGAAFWKPPTLDPDGAFAIFKGNTTIIKPAPVDGLVDTVGAGDTFMATLIASLFQTGRLNSTTLEAMSESDVELLLKRASCAAALNCEQAGCNPPDLRTLDEVYPVKMG